MGENILKGYIFKQSDWLRDKVLYFVSRTLSKITEILALT